MGIYSNPNDFRGFDDLVKRKKAQVDSTARVKQGKIDFLKEWGTTSATFDDMAGKGTDSDSGYLTTE